jgi:hypothetical protein
MILPLKNYDAQLACCPCNTKKKKKENSYGNVSNVVNNISFLKIIAIVLKRDGVHLDNKHV